MFAALITGRARLEMIEFPDPVPAEGGIVVDISFCGICGTDVHAYQSGAPYHPAICGHEWVGAVSAVGAGVRDLTEGDRVVVGIAPTCGRCAACRSGQSDHCQSAFLSAIGRDPLAPPHGGFAPRIAVSKDRVVRADPRLTDEQAAQVEPATVSFHAVRRSRLRLGDLAVIQGAGPIGLGTMQWVRAAGAGVVVVVEPNAERRRLAIELGAHHAVEPGKPADALVKELTHGLGADVVYECVGRSFAVQSAVDLTRRGGALCLIGLADEPAPIDTGSWLVKEVSVTSALAYTREEFEMSMGMIADGRFRTEPMHSSTVGLADLDATLSDLASGESTETKVLVDPRSV
jgi:(R,R)-butanediol dehydrogenase/meso-butanediol dehydrogenase/diacetyl reductase